MAFTFSFAGFLLAMGIELLFLVLLGQAAGAGVAILLAILVIAAMDFFWMRSMAIIAGQLLGFLSMTGVWYMLILVRVVH